MWHPHRIYILNVLSFSSPHVLESGLFSSEINLATGRKGKTGAGARVNADDVLESPLPGLSHPREAGGEGLVTYFSFQFCLEQEGDRKPFKGSP